MMIDVFSNFIWLSWLILSPPDLVDQKYCTVVGPDESAEQLKQRMAEELFEEVLLYTALTQCKNANPSKTDPQLLRNLLHIEKNAGVPLKYRGMVLAAACNESGYRANGRRGDSGKAVGILQMWPWWEKKFKVKRTDPYSSAQAWVSQIMRTVPKARKKCGKRRAFVSAWAWVASGPKKWKCRSPRHYTRLRRWHRVVKKDIDS
jgi:hypothetical protein